MKKLLFILSFVISVTTVKAQSWCTPASVWYYTAPSWNNSTDYVKQIYLKKESILQSQNLGLGFYFVNLIVDGNLIETQN